jgi:hypothetical protein
VALGQVFRVEAQAVDAGGVVAAVEVSTDYGDTWHPMVYAGDAWVYIFEASVLLFLFQFFSIFFNFS